MASQTKILAGLITQSSVYGVDWTSPENAASSDNVRASLVPLSANASEYIILQNWGFTIPTGSTIDGILVEVEGYVEVLSGAQLFRCQLQYNEIVKSNLKTIIPPTTESYISFGGASDKWNWTGVTSAELNNNSFQIAVQAYQSGGYAQNWHIDHVRVTVYYSCPTLNITTTSLPNGIGDSAYSQTVSATGGITPYTWNISAGALPTGLSINSSTGVISGTPTGVGTSFTVRCTDSCDTPQTDDQALSITIEWTKTLSDLVASVTESISVEKTTYDYTPASNVKGYILNMKTGGWVYTDNLPFVNAIYRPTTREIWGARRDKGQLSKINSGSTFDGTAIASVMQTGFMDFGELDEKPVMEAKYAEALKRLSAFFSEIKSEGNLTLTIYTENDATGKTFTITPATVDNTVYNQVRIALSRSIRGKYVSFKITNASGQDFWVGQTKVKILPRSIK